MATRVVEKAFSIITPEDHNALHGIYRHRCLNDRQLAEYFYKDLDDGKNDYTLMRINELVENWLTYIAVGDEIVSQLTDASEE